MKLPDIPQYILLPYESSYFDKVQSLFALAFGGRTINKDSWEWQFFKNPCLNERITTLWDGDVLVAVTGLTPAFSHLNGNPCMSACSGTTMARPDYMGVSIQLYKECAENNKDISLIYGFPNKNSFPITKFIGHHYVGDICFWTAKPVQLPKDSNVRLISKFTEEHGELYKELINSSCYLRDRSTSYLNWRFVDKPNNNYHVVDYYWEGKAQGYLVYNQYQEGDENHFQVVDIVATEIDVFEALLKFALNEAYETNSILLKMWMTHHRYYETLRNLGFEYGEHPFKCTFWDRDLSIEDCYFTMSDSDIF